MIAITTFCLPNRQHTHTQVNTQRESHSYCFTSDENEVVLKIVNRNEPLSEHW